MHVIYKATSRYSPLTNDGNLGTRCNVLTSKVKKEQGDKLVWKWDTAGESVSPANISGLHTAYISP